MAWGMNAPGGTGQTMTVFGMQTFMDYPLSGADDKNAKMSIGLGTLGVGVAFTDILNSSVQANSMLISVVPNDIQGRTDLHVAGAGFYCNIPGDPNTVPGVSFRIHTATNSNAGTFWYWLLHPAFV